MIIRLSKISSIMIAFFCSIIFAGVSDKEYKQLIKEDPFNTIYPKVIIKEATEYSDKSMALYEQSDIPEKYAQLIALAVSAAFKCQYCIPAHKIAAIDAGATEEEIKIAINIAADVAMGSTLFYGNEFDLDEFKSELKKISKEKKK